MSPIRSKRDNNQRFPELISRRGALCADTHTHGAMCWSIVARGTVSLVRVVEKKSMHGSLRGRGYYSDRGRRPEGDVIKMLQMSCSACSYKCVLQVLSSQKKGEWNWNCQSKSAAFTPHPPGTRVWCDRRLCETICFSRSESSSLDRPKCCGWIHTDPNVHVRI